MLARLGLSDDEVEAMRVQLLDVLDYIEMLQQVDTSSVPATAQVITHLNVVRPDSPRPSWPTEDILANAPDKDNGFFKVPPVLETENESTTGEVAGDNTEEERIG
jgi:aspartyl-tRNA(Asn)/glutamyl-tRNA(Gln) amidotransferase subunit C